MEEVAIAYTPQLMEERIGLAACPLTLGFPWPAPRTVPEWWPPRPTGSIPLTMPVQIGLHKFHKFFSGAAWLHQLTAPGLSLLLRAAGSIRHPIPESPGSVAKVTGIGLRLPAQPMAA